MGNLATYDPMYRFRVVQCRECGQLGDNCSGRREFCSKKCMKRAEFRRRTKDVPHPTVIQCMDCGTDLPRGRYGRKEQWCDPCLKVRRVEHAHEKYQVPLIGKWDQRSATSLKKYGITPDDFAVLWRKQGGVCAICHKPETVVDTRRGAIRKLCVDHDHATGKVRGLLCHRCNVNLGYWEDKAERAVEYLKECYAA